MYSKGPLSKRGPNGPGQLGWGPSSCFFIFVFSSGFHSVLLPLLASQLPGVGGKVSPSDPIHFFFALFLPVFFHS